MAVQEGTRSSTLRVLEEALGLTTTGDTTDAVATEGAYYLEQVTITEASEDDYKYEEIPDDNFSIPEGEEDLAKTIHMVQEQDTDTQILEKKTVLPSRHAVPEQTHRQTARGAGEDAEENGYQPQQQGGLCGLNHSYVTVEVGKRLESKPDPRL
uniref:Sperm-associated antigen 16 protein-like n=1 Tax=Castor canadensis TaxID=51338 RepID=A0A8B7U9P8_CASCN|nr:sperm-associated antigen 16 protein-like [Castor canadensis]